MGSLCGKQNNMAPGDDVAFDGDNSVTNLKVPGKVFQSSAVTNIQDFKKLKMIDDINEYYDLDDATILGQGAYGQVFKCMRKSVNKMVALKTVKKKELDFDNMNNMMSELEVLADVVHPNVMQVKELLHDKHKFYIATELCEGGELFDRLAEIGSFSEKNTVAVTKQILEAVNAMHLMDMVHRDLKPENVLMDYADESNFDIKIADFGFACLFDPTNGMDAYLGTPCYMAPEILQAKKYSEKVDCWSIGVIAFMLLSGQMLFNAQTTKQTKELILRTPISKRFKEALKHVSETGKDFLMKCFEREPQNRWSCAQLLGHPWIKKFDESNQKQITNEQKEEMMQNVKAFSQASKFTKSITSLLVGLTVDKNDLQLLKVAFKQIDSDNDGKITYDQFQQYQEELSAFGVDDKWQDIVKKTDLKKQGFMSYMDFITAATNHKKLLTQDNIKKAFALFDKSGTGVIDVGEFKQALPAPKKNQYSSSFVPAAYSNVEYKSVVETAIETLNNKVDTAHVFEEDEKKWLKIMKPLAVDGKVTYEQFSNAIGEFITQSYDQEGEGWEA